LQTINDKIIINSNIERIKRNGVMSNISIKTIAETLNLSPGTVSLVLNGHGDRMRISKKTQEKILEEAKKQGYKPNIYARRLRQKSAGNASTIIGILWPSLYSSELLVRFFEAVNQTILEGEANIEVVYKPYHYSKIEKISDVLTNNMFNGVIVVGASDSDVEFIKNVNCTMPIVFFNRQNEKYSTVCVDDYNTGNKVAELFHARGHKQVGLIESNLLSRHHSLRSLGFTDGCQRFGMELVFTTKETPTEEGGVRSALKLLESPKIPSAIFFAQSTMAPGVYKVFEERGIKISEDVELLAYGDTATNQLLRPTLSVIDLSIQNIVRKCIQLIMEMIKGNVQHQVTLLEDTFFIFRESCGGFPEK